MRERSLLSRCPSYVKSYLSAHYNVSQLLLFYYYYYIYIIILLIIITVTTMITQTQSAPDAPKPYGATRLAP
jgi:hypothetical protein